MTSEERAIQSDKVISTSEALHAELLREVDRLESFVAALQAAIDVGEVRRHD